MPQDVGSEKAQHSDRPCVVAGFLIICYYSQGLELDLPIELFQCQDLDQGKNKDPNRDADLSRNQDLDLSQNLELHFLIIS
jgi:hypothetical protein